MSAPSGHAQTTLGFKLGMILTQTMLRAKFVQNLAVQEGEIGSRLTFE